MDEEFEINPNCPWELEELTEGCVVYRQTTPQQRSGKPRRYPNETNFALRADEVYLSFNWDRHITVERNYKVIGITKNLKGQFLDTRAFTIFAYPANVLLNFDKVRKICHLPVYHDVEPSPEGMPNNRSHVGLFCAENDLAFRTSISDYCQENLNTVETHCNKAYTLEEIEELKNRGNDTPYHKDWNFDKYDL